MPTTTSDQGIPLPVDADTADNPAIFLSSVAAVQSRLVLRYTDEANRTSLHPASVEGELSHLSSLDRYECYDGTNWISLYRRTLFAYVRKTSDETVNNSTTLQNDDQLLIALPTAGTFGFRCILYYDSSTTGDFKAAFTMPAGATMLWGGIGPATGASNTTGDGQFGTATASGTAVAYGGAGTGTANTVILRIDGEITMGGTSGNLQLQWAQNTLDATNTVVRTRSRLEVWRSA